MNRDHIARIIARWLTPHDRVNLAATCATTYNLPTFFSVRANIESRAHHTRARELFMSCIRANHADDPAMCAATQRLFPLFLADDPSFASSITLFLSCARCLDNFARVCTRGYLDNPLEQDITTHPHCMSCAVVIARRDHEVVLSIPHARELCVIVAICNCCIRSFLLREDPCVVTPRTINVSMAIIARNGSDDDVIECVRNINASRMSAEAVQHVRRALFMHLAMRGRHEVIEKIVRTAAVSLG
jgi:hypothetical protein